jgi:hypothetical protein
MDFWWWTWLREVYGKAVGGICGNDAVLVVPPTRRCYRLIELVVSSRLGLHVDRSWLVGG